MDEGRPSPRVLALSLVGLAFFLAWQALALRSYSRVESRPPSWEPATTLQAAAQFRKIGSGARLGWAVLRGVIPGPRTVTAPPLYYLLLGPAMASSDPAGAALWLNWCWLALLCLAIFGLTWHFRPDDTALLAVVIFVGSPIVQELFHAPLGHLGLAALATAAYWALVRSDEFRYWTGSLAFGVLFAVGMLYHWSFATYFVPVVYVGSRALGRSGSWLKVVAAAAIALAGFIPWYWSHLPVLLPQLMLSPAISVAVLWKDWAILGYLGHMANGLGAPFFALALTGLCFPQYRRNWHRAWLLTAWFAASYVLWALVPQPQLRYLLPCLPALAVVGLSTWPRVVVWGLAVVQLFTMVNFTSGWISQISIPLPSGSLTLLPSQPPAREDWPIADILREARSRRDPQLPFANLTLVANDSRFNQANFEWTALRLGITDVRVRPVGSRLCEFSQFVVLKDGSLGPAGLVGNLPEVAKFIKDPHSWFRAAYEEVRRQPLPDGSAAVLYQQKRSPTPPVPGSKYQYQYQFYSSGKFEATDLVIEFGDWDAQRSVYRRAKISAVEVRVGAVRLTDLKAEAEGLLFQPIYERGSNTLGDLRLLKLGTLRIKSLRADSASVRAFLEGQIRGLRISELVLNKTVQLRGSLGRVRMSAEVSARLETSPPALRVELLSVRVGDTQVPDFFLTPFRTFVQPLTPTPEFPFTIEAPGLTLDGGWLSVP